MTDGEKAHIYGTQHGVFHQSGALEENHRLYSHMSIPSLPDPEQLHPDHQRWFSSKTDMRTVEREECARVYA